MDRKMAGHTRTQLINTYKKQGVDPSQNVASPNTPIRVASPVTQIRSIPLAIKA